MKWKFIFVLLLFSCVNESEYFTDGKRHVSKRYAFNDTIYVTTYDAYNRLLGKHCLVDDKLNGPYLKYDSLGSVIEKGILTNNRQMGEVFKYNGEGVLLSKNIYTNGLREGFQYRYFEDGEIDIVNYCSEDKSVYIKEVSIEKEDFIPIVDFRLKKDSISDIVEVELSLPIPDELLVDKQLYAFLGVGKNEIPSGKLEYPIDSFKIDNRGTYLSSFRFFEKAESLMIYGFIGSRIEGEEMDYQIFKKPFK